MNHFRKKPDDSFIQAEPDQADDRKYQEFDSLVIQCSLGEDPDDTQRIIGQKPQSESNSGRDQIMDFYNFCQEEKRAEIHTVGDPAHEAIPEELNGCFIASSEKERGQPVVHRFCR